MHVRLSEILEVEVVGEVTRVGSVFFDVALGKVALPDLDRERISGMIERLRQSFRQGLQVADRLHLQNSEQLVRGLVEVSIRTEESNSPYLLQLTTPALLALYHRRFLVEKDVLADLSGFFCRGLARLVAEGEGPLRILSGFQELRGQLVELLQEAVKQGIAGQAFDPAPGVAKLVPGLRRAWRLIPWSLRQGIAPCSRLEQDRIAPHDRVLERTLLVAAEQSTGKVLYQYLHQHNPLEDYDQVVGWMTEIHQAMQNTYPAPAYASAAARASTLEKFMVCYPETRGIVGPKLDA